MDDVLDDDFGFLVECAEESHIDFDLIEFEVLHDIQ